MKKQEKTNLLLVLDIIVQFVLIISRFVDNSGGQSPASVGGWVLVEKEMLLSVPSSLPLNS